MEFKFERASQAFSEILYNMRVSGVVESSRNGPVITIPEPVLLTITNPRDRIILCPARNANPFFHVMEVVWMMAGQASVEWLSQFNSRISDYADAGFIHGAYGHRWIYHWPNQLFAVIDRLQVEPQTRQAVLTMWDPNEDLITQAKDRPCNTHIYFRIRDGRLNMLVCNRSNDIVWGMFGANVVHMTYLQEFVAAAVGVELGHYSVITANLHFYPTLYPNADDIWIQSVVESRSYPCRLPLLHRGVAPREFSNECYDLINGATDFNSSWLNLVAFPMMQTYLQKGEEEYWLDAIADSSWQTAARQWIKRNRTHA